MNRKERIQEFKDYLQGNEGELVRVIYKRYQRKVREYGNFEKLDTMLIKDRNLVGRLVRVEDKIIEIKQNGEMFISIKFGVIESVCIIRRPDSERIRYKLYFAKRY